MSVVLGKIVFSLLAISYVASKFGLFGVAQNDLVSTISITGIVILISRKEIVEFIKRLKSEGNAVFKDKALLKTIGLLTVILVLFITEIMMCFS